MTNDPGPADSPRQLLLTTRKLTQQVRQAQRATWFPLVLLGLVVIAAAPFYRLTPGVDVTCGPIRATAHGGLTKTCVASIGWAAFTYWAVTLVLAYALIAGFYLLRARRRGVGTRIVPYALAGVAGLALVVLSVWPVQRVLGQLHSDSPASLVVHGLNPLVAIGLALFVLVWAERNWALLVFAAGYLTVAIVTTFTSLTRLLRDLGWVVAPHWVLLPRLWLAGAVLLLGGACFAIAERVRA
jgi:hypothetical protein